MNPGIFYLYEYNNMQKLRNVGFLKLTRHYHSCILQLNARGIPVTRAETLKLCAFYLENDTVGATVLAEIPSSNRMVSARLNFAECQFPDGHTLNTMDGFFLPLSNGRILAAAVPGILVDARKLLSVFEAPPSAESFLENTKDIPETEETSPNNGNILSERTDTRPNQENAVPDTMDAVPELQEPDDPEIMDTEPEPQEPAVPDTMDAVPEPQEPDIPDTMDAVPEPQEPDIPDTMDAVPEPEETAVLETLDTKHDTESQALQTQDIAENCEEPVPCLQDIPPCIKEDTPETQDCPPDDKEISKDPPQQTVRKIQRSDMSALPRCYWHLANNSFLLHSYHNYSHLLLVEKDGHYWLGVPGIYDSHEARAARLFGFPQFTDSYNDQLQLSDDEQNSQGTFGYWCCYLK
ncbi:MAG: hypothetical protein HFH15_16750 [Ruminococcus sp.]|nr:hypothetical protein [Ruminococcus sp.]